MGQGRRIETGRLMNNDYVTQDAVQRGTFRNGRIVVGSCPPADGPYGFGVREVLGRYMGGGRYDRLEEVSPL